MNICEEIEQLINIKDYKKALEKIESNQLNIFLNDPIHAINNHLYLLIETSQYDKCYKVLDEYSSYPYVNIKVEEHFAYLRDNLANLIKEAVSKKEKERNKDENGVDFTLFHSKRQNDILTFLAQINRSNNIQEYEYEIDNILKRNLADQINFLCLSLFYKSGSKKVVDFQYKSSQCSIDLGDFKFPFSTKDSEYLELQKYFDSEIKDVSIQSACQDLLISIRLNCFPNSLEKSDLKNIKEAILYVANRLFGENYQFDESETTKKYIKMVDSIINS